MLAIIDYGMGNLLSVCKAFEACGASCRVLTESAGLSGYSGVILPGVGAFADAMMALREEGWVEEILKAVESGRPFIGICLGMQLLFSCSEEDGEHEGLDLISGRVIRFQDRPGFHVPHMGWNQLSFPRPCPLFSGLNPGDYVYFVHSYYPVPDDPSVVVATTDYGEEIAVGVARGQVFGVQFHPEKSQAVGLQIVKNFIALAEGGIS